MPISSNPEINCPVWRSPQRDKTIELKLKVVTPMFGGGFEAGVVDDLVPIRAAAIRGHLRFWWRATAGAKYATAEELHAAEAELWGESAHQDPKDSNRMVGESKVRLQVCVTNPGITQKCATYHKRKDGGGYKALPDFEAKWPPYALQAFQGKASLLNAEFVFLVTLRDGEHEAAVRQALAAWIKFGGLGARTRRGCGSLFCATALNLDGLSPARFTELTALSGSVAIWGSTTNNPLEAWAKAVKIYHKLRQGENFARNPGQHNRPGRSRWPEADAIRRIQRRHSNKHAPTHAVKRGFPRADLGLPIIFHFKDDGDPSDATLQGPSDGLIRFASPVITKAVAVQDGYKPLVLVLSSPHAWQFGPLRLDGHEVTEEMIRLNPALRKQVPPLQGEEIREALIRYVEQEWHVKRKELR